MKKYILLFLTCIVSFSGFFVSSQDVSVVETINITDYYGYLPLIINLHQDIGMNYDAEEENEKNMDYLIDLLKNMKYFANMDVIEYLSHTFNVEKSLNYLLFDMDELIYAASLSISELDNLFVSLEQKKEECDLFKKDSDKNYSLSFEDLDAKNMNYYLQKSILNDNCSSYSRIYYNAYMKIFERLEFYVDVLKNKYAYLKWNTFEIVENYDQIFIEHRAD